MVATNQGPTIFDKLNDFKHSVDADDRLSDAEREKIHEHIQKAGKEIADAFAIIIAHGYTIVGATSTK